MMILYSDKIDPVSHCVRLTLAEKDINVKINFIDDNDSWPEELSESNPYHDNVLTLIDRQLNLYDAHIIMEYLDERFPYPQLMPLDPMERAKTRQLRYRLWRDLYIPLTDFADKNDIEKASARKLLRDYIATLSQAVEKTPYFMATEYTLLDCCMAALLWRLRNYGINPANIPKPMQEYASRLFQRNSFKQSLSEIESEFN